MSIEYSKDFHRLWLVLFKHNIFPNLAFDAKNKKAYGILEERRNVN